MKLLEEVRARFKYKGLDWLKILLMLGLGAIMAIFSYPSSKGITGIFLFILFSSWAIVSRKAIKKRTLFGILSLASILFIYPEIEFHRFLLICHFLILFYAFLLPGLGAPLIAGLLLLFRLKSYTVQIEAEIIFIHCTLIIINSFIYSHVVSMIRKLTKQKTELSTTLHAIEHMAYYDTLSGLPNRRHFNTILGKSITMANRTNSKLAVVYIDLDRFKYINDTYGHICGDELIEKASERIKLGLGNAGIAGRQGGDEFLLLLNYLESKEEVVQIIQSLISSFNEPFILEGRPIKITLSAGIAIFPDDSEAGGDLIRKADTALYKTKETGRNSFSFYNKGMEEVQKRRLLFEECIRESWAAKDFQIYYQPQFDLRTNRMIGTEALLRWHHPKLGWVPPSEFIPVLEETGLIIAVGNWVLEESCKQFKAWKEKGLIAGKIAVNISGIQFNREDFVPGIKKILEDLQLDPKYLELELTESVAIKNFNESAGKIKELSCMGVNAALDDFGTGYSSLSYLQKFPFGTIKIDKSFIEKIWDHESSEAEGIIEIILLLAKKMKIEVIAEGIERDNQLMFLLERGCYSGQGFLFSTPLSGEEFARTFANEFSHETTLPVVDKNSKVYI